MCNVTDPQNRSSPFRFLLTLNSKAKLCVHITKMLTFTNGYDDNTEGKTTCVCEALHFGNIGCCLVGNIQFHCNPS